jgi:hypothetical protein
MGGSTTGLGTRRNPSNVDAQQLASTRDIAVQNTYNHRRFAARTQWPLALGLLSFPRDFIHLVIHGRWPVVRQFFGDADPPPASLARISTLGC